ncbi:MAG: hypothetical protein KAG37_01085 [Flavobacteriales bacterium]|nr:hypothetical protein [Flavobacteriales bacterium]
MEKQEANFATRIIVVTSLLSLIYVVVRYHIAGDVPWKDFPFFILNKGISLSAFILLTINFTVSPLSNLGVKVSKGWVNSTATLGFASFILVFAHVFISVMIFNPQYYSKFFETDGTLTLFAGLSMLAGVITLMTVWVYNISFKTNLRDDKGFIKIITSRNFLLLTMLFGGIHLFFMGFKGWLNPAGWNGIPPVSLVAFTFFVVGYLINIFGRK